MMHNAFRFRETPRGWGIFHASGQPATEASVSPALRRDFAEAQQIARRMNAIAAEQGEQLARRPHSCDCPPARSAPVSLSAAIRREVARLQAESAQNPTPAGQAMSPERRQRLLGGSELGRAILRDGGR